MEPIFQTKLFSVDGFDGRVPVQLLIDAQGTSFLQLNPLDVLSAWEQDIYFMGEPGLGTPEDKKHLLDIIAKYSLESIAESIMDEPNYKSYPDIKKLFYLGDRLCYEFLKKDGLSDDAIAKIRAEISAKVYYMADKELFRNLKKEFPDVKIYVISQAGQYMRGAFEQLLREEKYSDIDVIVAPDEKLMRFTKMDPELYRLISKLHGLSPRQYGLLDDKQIHVDAAVGAGMHGKLHERGNSGQLLDNAVELANEVRGYHKEGSLWVSDNESAKPKTNGKE